MHITEDDAAFMYARACRAWYGSKAKHIVRKRIKELQRARDEAGVRIWNQVADQLAQLPRHLPRGSFFD
jgi:hypothetical protein